MLRLDSRVLRAPGDSHRPAPILRGLMLWVLVRNFGYEGRSPPLQIFENKTLALAALALGAAGGEGTLEVFEVPVWPTPAVARPEPMAVP